MKTRLAALASVLVLGAAVVGNGCADNRASLQVQAICIPTADCAFGATCEGQYIGYPTLDLTASARDTLWLVLQLENALLPNEKVEAGRANTNDAHVDETVIEYDGVALPKAMIGSNFHVPAGGTSVVSVEVIPDMLAAGTALADFATAEPREMVARLRMRGYFDDGTRFETGEFPITIRVCEGCLTLDKGELCLATDFTCPPDSNGQAPVSCITPQ